MKTNEALNQTFKVLDIHKICISPRNPRKTIDREALSELSQSISETGVVQAILVRPLSNKKYEIVCGERRFRASLLAGKTTIPAEVRRLTAAEALTIALIENLQRENITPFEEARTIQGLLKAKRYSMQDICKKIGKNEREVCARLRLLTLLPELLSLAEDRKITIEVATELTHYPAEVQQAAFKEHFSDTCNHFESWRELTIKKLKSLMEQTYSSNLTNFVFDKKECMACPYNTNNTMLFVETESIGHCTNRACLSEKIASDLLHKVVDYIKANSLTRICQPKYNTNKTVIDRLKAMGFEVEMAEYIHDFPTLPEPERYSNPEIYQTDKSSFDETMARISEGVKKGELIVFIRVHVGMIDFCYREAVPQTAGEITGKIAPKEVQIEELKEKDRFRKEKALENKVADVRVFIKDAVIPDSAIQEEEEKIILFFMLSNLKREHFPAVGVEQSAGFLSDVDKIGIINGSLTENAKNIIRHDFILEEFRTGRYSAAAANLFLNYARLHFPAQVEKIEAKHDREYNNYHTRIEEQINALTEEKKTERGEEAA